MNSWISACPLFRSLAVTDDPSLCSAALSNRLCAQLSIASHADERDDRLSERSSAVTRSDTKLTVSTGACQPLTHHRGTEHQLTDTYGKGLSFDPSTGSRKENEECCSPLSPSQARFAASRFGQGGRRREYSWTMYPSIQVNALVAQRLTLQTCCPSSSCQPDQPSTSPPRPSAAHSPDP